VTGSCEHATNHALGAYVDGELTGAKHTWWERHLRTCADCGDEVRRVRDLGRALRQNLPLAEPSAALRENVRRAAQSPKRTQQLSSTRPDGPLWWRQAIAAVFLLGAGIGVGWTAAAQRDTGSMLDQVIAAHVRSLQVDHLVDVTSSERHVVKPWFAGKLDFSPPVPDLAVKGFPLIGGRTEYLDGRPVAAVVYRRGLHQINLFVWPADRVNGCRQESPQVEHGLNVVRGQAAGMELWAVSDVNPGDLRVFVAEALRFAARGKDRCSGW
jgi:anti-sigma factor RsiW